MDFIKGKWSDIVLKHLKERYLMMRIWYIWYIILHRKHCQIKGNIKKKKRYTHPYVHGSFTDNSQDMEANKVSTKRQMDKGYIYIYIYIHFFKYIYMYFYIFTHTHTGIWLSHKKEWNLATTWMDLEGIMLSEIQQTEKENYFMMSLICRIYKTKQVNKHNKTEMDS